MNVGTINGCLQLSNTTMESSDIFLSDWQRIIFGELPYSFLLEALIRTTVIYMILVTSLRLMGKRMSAQMSRNELAGMAALAAAIGVPLQAPDRGILPAIVVAVTIVGISRLVAVLVSRYPKFEQITQGEMNVLVRDAVLDIDTMDKVRISKEKLFSVLRSENVRHLGEVKRLYIEAGGDFTLIRQEQPQPGLSVAPEWDESYCRQQKKSEDIIVCANCGHVTDKHTGSCKSCGCTLSVAAVAS